MLIIHDPQFSVVYVAGVRVGEVGGIEKLEFQFTRRRIEMLRQHARQIARHALMRQQQPVTIHRGVGH